MLGSLRNMFLFKILFLFFSSAPNRFRSTFPFGTNKLRNMYLRLLEVHFQVPTPLPQVSPIQVYADPLLF